MKDVYELADEAKKSMYLSSFEQTQVLVFMSYIIDKPYRDHRFEMKRYSIRYRANDNHIYIYDRRAINDNDTEYLDCSEITNDYIAKIYIKKTIEETKGIIMRFFFSLSNKIRKWLNTIKII